MKNQRTSFVMLALIIATGLFVLVHYLRQIVGLSPEDLAVIPSRSETAPVTSSSVQPRVSASPLLKIFQLDSLSQIFLKRFGEDLQLQFMPNGSLVSARGNITGGIPAGAKFKSDDPQKAIERAREIISVAGPLLGLRADLPLERPIAKGNELSVQVYFKETIRGEPIAPLGRVSVDLGSQGELIGLDSQYVKDVIIKNKPKLNADSARAFALASVIDHSMGLRPEGGSSLVWVSPSSQIKDSYEGRHAFEYMIQGRQIIVDAETGKILFQRDRRNF